MPPTVRCFKFYIHVYVIAMFKNSLQNYFDYEVLRGDLYFGLIILY